MISAPSQAAPAVDAPQSRASGDPIEKAVQSQLRASGYGSLREIDCQVREGVAVLSGVVPSFHMKQMAQTIVMKLDDVSGIENRLRVKG